MALSEQDVQDYIVRKLGGGVLCVELTPDQLTDAVERAKLWLQQWVGQQKTYMLTFTGNTQYTPPTDCEAIVDVVFATSSDSLFDMFKWAGVEMNIADFALLDTDAKYVDVVQRMQYLELGKRVLSAERAWDFDRALNRLVVSPAPASGEVALVYYLAKTLTLSYLKSYEQALLQDYALAQAMETLGYIRTKFAEIPTASGTTSMNGDTLLSNAQQLMDKCEERARNLVPPMPFFLA